MGRKNVADALERALSFASTSQASQIPKTT
jgi:hypothetical protein